MSSRRPAIRRIALALSMTASTLVSAPALADTLFSDADTTNSYEPPVDRSASEAAREELAEARLMLSRARIASGEVQRAAENDLRTAGGARSLEISAAQAISNYNAARRPTLNGLSKDAEYRKLSEQRDEIRLQIRRIADQKKTSYEQLLPLARQALEAGERMTRTESIALALDPAIEDARDAMTEAFAALRRVNSDARTKATDGPVVAMARQDVAEARERVAAANANLVAALRAEADADRARRQRRST